MQSMVWCSHGVDEMSEEELALLQASLGKIEDAEELTLPKMDFRKIKAVWACLAEEVGFERCVKFISSGNGTCTFFSEGECRRES